MQIITGNKFKRACHYSYDEFGYVKKLEPQTGEILRVFVKIDYVHSFFSVAKPNVPYILVTHNGDLPVDHQYKSYFEDPLLVKWFGQNININHPKVFSIPIGIANETWPHGDENVLLDIMNDRIKKDHMVYVNFDVNTNRSERNFCLSQLNKRGLKMEEKLPFKEYLNRLASSYFVISPNGNGIDCHKTWEALYLKTVPIITRSTNAEFYRNFPMLIIDSWEELDLSILNKELYQKIWGNFELIDMTVGRFINEQ